MDSIYPHASADLRPTPTRTERHIIKVRIIRRWGPARIAYLLGLNVSTVHKVVSRYGLARLRWLDRPTGRVIRRMDSPHCGDLVRVDVKKLGMIPAGGGWRKVGRSAGRRSARADKSSGEFDKYYRPVRGYHFLHTAIDAHYGWPTPNCWATNAKPPPPRSGCANAWFAENGITVEKVLTDNGSCYRSHAFRDSLGQIKHRPTHPYRPQTNGKVERFHRRPRRTRRPTTRHPRTQPLGQYR